MNCFLSHSSSDKTWFVEQVYERLPKETTIIDKNNFRAAAYTKSEIENFIKISQVFVYFISNASLESRWVQDEVKIAEELCNAGQIKLFIPIILDSTIQHDDSRFSPWLQNNFILKYLGGPKYVAKRIRDDVSFLKLNLNPVLKTEFSLCLGRYSETSKFVNRYEDFTQPKLKTVIANGIPKIGRKTFLRNILSASQLKPAFFRAYEITMDERSSIEDFIAKLEPISDTTCSKDLSGMLTKSMSQKKELALHIVNELSSRGEIILINDENCVIDYSGNFVSWFVSILNDCRFPQKLVFLLASKRMLFRPPSDVLCVSLSELKHLDSISIFSRLLAIRKKSLTTKDMLFWTNLMVGHPGQIKHTINILEKNNYIEELAEKESYQVTDYLTNQAAIILHEYLTNQDYCWILRFFALAEFASFELYNKIFSEDKYTDIFRNLINLNILEFVGENHDFIRLNGVLRDYVLRNTNKFSTSIVNKIKSLTDDFISSNFNNEDVSQSLFLATSALESSGGIDIKDLFPIHIIKAMINIYNRGDNYNRVIELANSLLDYKNNIAENIVNDALYYKCMSLARLQDRTVLNEIQLLSPDTATFVKGFFYRRTGRALNAIYEFNKIKDERFIGHRARREIVLALQQLEQYDEAVSWARDNYNINHENYYHIQALFKCIIYGSEIERNKAAAEEAKTLIAKLKNFTNDQAKEMATLAEAQFLAFVEKKFTQAYDITSDAISQFPDSKYPILTQMDIALKHGNYEMSETTHVIINDYLSSHQKVPSRIFARPQAYFLAGTGRIEEAKTMLVNELNRLDDSAKDKLLSKLNFYNLHRLK